MPSAHIYGLSWQNINSRLFLISYCLYFLLIGIIRHTKHLNVSKDDTFRPDLSDLTLELLGYISREFTPSAIVPVFNSIKLCRIL